MAATTCAIRITPACTWASTSYSRRRRASLQGRPRLSRPSLAGKNEGGIMLGAILIVVLIMALLGALPRWPHSREWGYAPTGGVGLILVIVVVLLLLGRLCFRRNHCGKRLRVRML